MTNFDNSYARLPEHFFQRVAPSKVSHPEIMGINHDLAAELGFSADALTAEILSGNQLLSEMDPIAQAYAGHQFGGFVPQLGDGRAVLLGEVIGKNGRQDIVLKGAGRTIFSRGGDGRAWLGPVMREYIVSEAMHALQIPTTRALAALRSGDLVQRERALPGAIFARVAKSHIREGTFQYFAARNDVQAIETLYEYSKDRHYQQAKNPLEFLACVGQKQAELIAKWMSIGFIHGVMNTDNTAISGETIDYGPCAFMDHFSPNRVFSSIDAQGRYAYQAQPNVGIWNLSQLAMALMPIIDENQDVAADMATEVLNGYAPHFHKIYREIFSQKLGFISDADEDLTLINQFMALLSEQEVDFTEAFIALEEGRINEILGASDDVLTWVARWRERISETDFVQVMRSVNPKIIPRNHVVEAAITASIDGDDRLFHQLNIALKNPFEPSEEARSLLSAPRVEERVLRTFCGT